MTFESRYLPTGDKKSFLSFDWVQFVADTVWSNASCVFLRLSLSRNEGFGCDTRVLLLLLRSFRYVFILHDLLPSENDVTLRRNFVTGELMII